MMIGGAARVLAPLAGGLAIKETISAAADFETALSGIQKKAGTTAEQTTKLGEEIKELATSGELAVPITEIFGAYERGAAAGLPVESLKEFARLSVKAADAFDMPAEAVGNFAAKLKTSLGQSDQDIRETFDLVNSLADSGIADESAIVDYVDRSGASLKTLGLNMRDTLSLGSTFLNLGMTSDVAATASDTLARKMLTVGTLTGKGRKSFERFMGPVGKFSKLVGKDANEALLTMLDRIKDMNSQDRMSFLKDFVGDEHSGKILRLAQAVGELRRNEALADDPSKWFGSLTDAYKLKLDTFWAQWQVFKNQLGELSIDVGTMGMPAAKAALEEVRTIVKQIDEGLGTFGQQIDTRSLSQAKDAIAGAAQSVADLIGVDTSQSALPKFFSDLADVVNDVAATVNAIDQGAQQLRSFFPKGDDGKSPTAPPDREYGPKAFHMRIGEGGLADRWLDALERTYDRLTGETPRVNFDPTPDLYGRTTTEKAPRLQRPTPPTSTNVSADPTTAPSSSQAVSPVGSAPPVGATSPVGSAPPALPRIPVPTARPNLAAPVQEQSDQAAQAAEAARARIDAAFNVTARPDVDTTGLQAANREADAFIAKMRSIPGLVERARSAAATMPSDLGSGRTSRVDFDGLHADTTHPGF